MLLKLHKYAGLIVGLLLALTGVTGSLLVFHDTLDEWLTPQLRTEPAAEAALPGKGPFRLNFDLHKAAGFYITPVLLVAAFSGVSLVFHGPVQALVGTALPLEAMPAPTLDARPDAGPGLNVDQIVAAGQNAFPEGALKRVDLPRDTQTPYRLSFNQPGEAWSHHGASRVWVDPRDGTVLATWDPLSVAAGSRFMGWQFPLHNGDALGLAGRWLVFLGGWLPALLFGTGLYLWWRKHQLRRRSRRSR